MHTVSDLDGTNIARAIHDDGDVSLTISSASGFGTNGYYPAESMTLTGIESITNLHAICAALIEAHAEAVAAKGDAS